MTSDLQAFRSAVNNVLETALAMIEQLRALEPFWDLLSEEDQAKILEALVDLEGINAVVHLGVQNTGSLADQSVKSGIAAIRKA